MRSCAVYDIRVNRSVKFDEFGGRIDVGVFSDVDERDEDVVAWLEG